VRCGREIGLTSSSRRDFSDKVESRSGSVKPRARIETGSRRGTQPLTLQGIWNADVRPAWSSNLTTNINTQMNYWGRGGDRAR
jgi:hypothetical protein